MQNREAVGGTGRLVIKVLNTVPWRVIDAKPSHYIYLLNNMESFGRRFYQIQFIQELVRLRHLAPGCLHGCRESSTVLYSQTAMDSDHFPILFCF